MILPLKDINPTQRTPYVTIALIAANVVVFLYELTQGHHVNQLIAAYGATPYELTHLTDLVGRYQGVPVAHAPGPSFVWLTVFSSMFLHGGFMHLFGNMLFLWIFGNNVEDVLGPFKFLFFYLVCGVAAAVAHTLSGPNSMIPTVGASGAISGVLGGYLLAYPRARVVCLLFLVIFFRLIVLPANLVIIFWFVIQAFQGVASISAGATGGVAWFAHVGGFIAGVVLIKMMAPERLQALKAAREWQDDFNRRGY